MVPWRFIHETVCQYFAPCHWWVVFPCDEYIMVHLKFHPLKDIWVVFNFKLIWVNLQWIYSFYVTPRALPGGSVVKNLPVVQKMQEILVRSLGHEEPLEEGIATHSSILAWRIPWREELGGLQSMGLQWVDMTEHSCTQVPVRERKGKGGVERERLYSEFRPPKS